MHSITLPRQKGVPSLQVLRKADQLLGLDLTILALLGLMILVSFVLLLYVYGSNN